MTTHIIKAGTTILGAVAFVSYYAALLTIGYWTSSFRKAFRYSDEQLKGEYSHRG